ncbi:MAG: methyltransferase domain-containing protein [Candidatus Latescibacteria bacterium]|nr:methyltransferase domain-containing protein [bacterium]MBD3425284.1 methyltransferase domain-containing protein [Candidatus Latescibacterota bacterium]
MGGSVMNCGGSKENDLEKAYNLEAEETGWFGPEVVFGLSYRYIKPGQSILDIGTGTGLAALLYIRAGLKAHGMDISERLLDICREKQFESLVRHDLTRTPYPYPDGSMDHAVCTGVLNFFDDLSVVFSETSRIIRPGGLFGFVVGDRYGDMSPRIEIEASESSSKEPVTMYRHGRERVREWMREYRFKELRTLPFTVYMDRGRQRDLVVRAYLAEKLAAS